MFGRRPATLQATSQDSNLTPDSLPNMRFIIHLVSGLLLIGCAEAFLRTHFGLGHPPLVYANKNFSYAFRANQSTFRFGHRITYNAEGLRSEPLQSGAERVLCVGDSVTNGGARTDQLQTYPYKLEMRLNETRRHIQVLNASAGGWALDNEDAFINARGLFGAKFVVFQIGIADLEQPTATLADVADDPNFPTKEPPLAIAELISRYAMPKLRNVLQKPPTAPRTHPVALEHCLSTVHHMIETARSQGAVPFVLVTPNREELISECSYSWKRKHLLLLCKALSVRYADTLMLFRAAKNQEQPMFRDNIHPNERGNEVLAAAAAEMISADLSSAFSAHVQ